jgi:hypothetical protein
MALEAPYWYCDEETLMPDHANLSEADELYKEALHHALTCKLCCLPIVDSDGNPGLFGEACSVGVKILIRYTRALGEPVPPWVERTLV